GPCRWSDRFLQLLGGAEGDLLAGLDLDRLAGCGVAAHAGGALAHLEDAEPPDADALAFLQVLGDPRDDVGQDALRLFLGQLLLLGDRRGEVLERDGGWTGCLLRHVALLVVIGGSRKIRAYQAWGDSGDERLRPLGPEKAGYLRWHRRNPGLAGTSQHP